MPTAIWNCMMNRSQWNPVFRLNYRIPKYVSVLMLKQPALPTLSTRREQRNVEILEMGCPKFFDKSPQPLLWTCSRAAPLKITIITAKFIVCNTCIIYTCGRELQNTCWGQRVGHHYPQIWNSLPLPIVWKPLLFYSSSFLQSDLRLIIWHSVSNTCHVSWRSYAKANVLRYPEDGHIDRGTTTVSMSVKPLGRKNTQQS